MMEHAKRGVLSVGCEVSFATDDEMGFVTSPGAADPRLYVRQGHTVEDLLGFESSVFVLCRPPALDFASSQCETVTYGMRLSVMHKQSGLYVALLPTHPAPLDPSCHTLTLLSKEDALNSTHFKIVPRYKVHSEGDAVCHGDQILLQLFDKLLYLHTSEAGTPVTELTLRSSAIDDDIVEVNGADVATPWVIRRYDFGVEDPDFSRYTTRLGKDGVLAGAPVVLFHREKEALLITSTTTPKVRSLAHTLSGTQYQRRRSHTQTLRDLAHASLSQPSGNVDEQHPCPLFLFYDSYTEDTSFSDMQCSCSALWTFESVDPTCGGPLRYGELYRLRQTATNLYLAVHDASSEDELEDDEAPDITPQLVLVPRPTSEDELRCTLFSPRPFFDSEAIYLTAQDFLRVQHVETGLWLSTDPDAELIQTAIRLRDRATSHDALLVGHVRASMQRDVLFLFHTGEFLRKYVAKFAELVGGRFDWGKVNTAVMCATEALASLIRFCTISNDTNPLTREGLPIAEHQRMMLDLQFHRVVFATLVSPFVAADVAVGCLTGRTPGLPLTGGILECDDLLKTEYQSIHYVCRLCYRLFKQMVKGSAQFGTFLVDYVPYMYAQDGQRLHVADTTEEIFSNNAKMPHTVCRAAVDHYVKLLCSKNRSAGYLKFLSAMCTTNGESLKSNQELVCNLLLRKAGHTLVRTVLLPYGVGVAIKKNEPPMPIEAFLMAPPDGKLAKFFESQIELLSALCIGSHTSICNVVESVIPSTHIAKLFETVMWTPKDTVQSVSRLDHARNSVFHLAVNLCILPLLRNAEVLTRCNAVLWPRSSLRKKSPFVSGVEDTPLIAVVKDVAMKILETNPFQVMENKCRNRLLTTVVRAWHTFVSYYQYTVAQLEALLPLLRRLLSGVDDILTTRKARFQDAWSRFEQTEENAVVMETKDAVCRLLNLALERCCQQCADNILVTLLEPLVSEHQQANSAEEKSPKHAPPKTAHNVMKLVEEEMQHVIDFFAPQLLMPLLIDAGRYSSSTLTAHSLELVVNLASVRTTVSGLLLRANILPDAEAVALFDSVYLVGVELELCVHDSTREEVDDAVNMVLKTLIGKSLDDDPLQDTTQTVPELSFSAPAPTNQPNLQADPNAASLDRSGSSMRRKRRALSMWGCCRAVVKVMSFSKVVQKQRNTVHGVDVGGDVLKRAEVMRHWNIHRTMLKLLRTMPQDHPTYPTIMEFFYFFTMVPANAIDLVPDLALFIQGVTHSIANRNCMHIVVSILSSATDDHDAMDRSLLKKLVDLIAQQKKETSPDSSFIHLVNRSVIGSQMLPTNQRFLLNLLTTRDLLDRIGSVTPQWSSSQMVFNSALVMLVCNCCIGNATTRHMAQRLLPPATLFNILLATEQIPVAHQVPYYRFLSTVLLVADDDTPQDCAHLKMQWMQNERWWELLAERVIPQLRDFAEVIKREDPTVLQQFLDKYREIIFPAMLGVVCAFFAECFSAQIASRIESSCFSMSDLCVAFLELIEDARSIEVLNPLLTAHEIALVKRVAAYLSSASEELDLESVRERLRIAKEHIDEASWSSEVDVPNNPQSDRSGSVSVVTCSASMALSTIREALREINAKDAILNACEKDATSLFVQAILEGSASTNALLLKLQGHLKTMDFAPCTTAGILRILRRCFSDIGDSTEAKMALQKHLDALGMVRVVTSLLDVTDDSVVQASLELGIAILEGGNTTVQNNMLQYFNTHDERFFHNVKDILVNAVATARRENQQRQQQLLHAIPTVSFAAMRVSSPKSANGTTLRSYGIPAYRFIERVFRLLQLMCEGHHLGMQNYIREQSDNLHSINIVREVAGLMKELCSNINSTTIPMVLRGFALFTEFCQGPCPANQLVLLNNNICRLIVQSLECNIEDQEEEVAALKAVVTTTILSLLEGCNDATFYQKIVAQLPVPILGVLMTDLMTALGPHLDRRENDERLDSLFNLIIYLHQVHPHAQGEVRHSIAQLLQSFEHLSRYLGCIEIERGDHLEKVYFRIPFICTSLTSRSKDKLLWSVDRSTQSTKLGDFFHQSDALIFEMESAHRFQRLLSEYTYFDCDGPSSQPRRSLGRHMIQHAALATKRCWNTISPLVFHSEIGWYENLSLCIAIVVNVMFVTLDAVDQDETTTSAAEWWVIILGTLQLLLCTTLLGIDSLVYLPVHVYAKLKKAQRKNAGVQLQLEDMHSNGGMLEGSNFSSSRGDYSSAVQAAARDHVHHEKENNGVSAGGLVRAASTRFISIYRLAMVLLCILGLGWSPLLFCRASVYFGAKVRHTAKRDCGYHAEREVAAADDVPRVRRYLRFLHLGAHFFHGRL